MVVRAATAALDTVTIIGIVLCATKGADLLLRPHQEEALKGRLESLTLWLSYANPLAYYRKVVNRRLLNIIGLLVGAATFPFYRRIVLRFMTLHEDKHALAFLGAIGVGLWSIRTVNKHYPWMTGVTTGRYAQEQKRPFGLPQFTVATGEIIALLSAMSVFVGGVVYLLPSLLIDHTLRYDKELAGYALVAAAPYFYVIAELGVCAAAVLLACMMLAALQGATVTLRAVLWRVVEYGKGPVAACTVIVTVILGLLDLYVRAGAKGK